MNRIQTVSTHFLGLLKFLIVFLPCLALFKWLFISANFMHHSFIEHLLIEPYRGPEGNILLSDVAWTPFTQLLGFISNMIGLLPILISLFALIRIFQQYQSGEIFNMMSARYYRLIGWMFILDGLITQSLGDSLMTIAVTLNATPGHRYITFGFGSPNLEALFCGAVVIVVSWVMLEASKLHEEHKYTV